MLQRISQVQKLLNTTKDVAAVWLQDWSGLRNFSGKGELDRVGLWWNWEVRRYKRICYHVVCFTVMP